MLYQGTPCCQMHSWSICDEMREETGAENVPPFPLVRIGNQR